MLTNLLNLVIDKNASDLHLSPDEYPLIRIDGEVERQEHFGMLAGEEILKMLKPYATEKHLEQFNLTNDCDFSFEHENRARFRVNLLKQNRGIGAVLRLIPSKVLSMEELKLGEIFRTICGIPRGLVLVTGPTGSGKSTTLATMIDFINETRKEHILTIEDPIEFVHKSKKSLITQREINRDTASFKSALKAALREDPDIILVGEMRDLETIQLALSAAETGHLVFGTLHTTSAAKTMDRIIDAFPAEDKDMIRTMLSESLQAVISQTLIKKINGGRVAAHEIMIATPAIRNLIRENKVAQINAVIQTGRTLGMISLDQALLELVGKKVVEKSVAKSVAASPDKF